MSQQTVAITGASSGIGAALAEEYAAPGFALYLCGRDQRRLDRVAENCRNKGADVHTATFDVTDASACKSWIDSIPGNLDILIANAGLSRFHTRAEIESVETFTQVANVNLLGYVNVVVPAATRMKQQKEGRIGLISSLAALQPLPDSPSYAATKLGVNGYGEALGYYLYPDGVSVSVICPGFIETPMTEDHTNWRPFQMTASKAAKKIRNAIHKRKWFYAFPKLLVLNIWLGRVSPWSIRRIAIKVFCQ